MVLPSSGEGPGWAALLLAAAVTLAGGAAQAQVAVCNSSDAVLDIVDAYPSYEGGFTSVGPIPIRPGSCRNLGWGYDVGTDYYYRVDTPLFTGADRQFCVSDDGSQWLEDAETCAGVGHLAWFRLLQVPEAGGRVVVNVDADGTELAAPDLPVIDLSQPFEPVARPAPPEPPLAEVPPAEIATVERLIGGGISSGSLGQSYSFAGFWDACIDGTECSFYSEGWRFVARAADGTPEELLNRLRTVAPGTAVTVVADVVIPQANPGQVAISEVRVAAESPFQPVFWALQGRWQRGEDPQDFVEIDGLQLTVFAAGVEDERAYLLPQQDCAPESTPAGSTLPLALVLHTIPDYERECVLLERLTEDELVLEAAEGGETLRLHRP